MVKFILNYLLYDALYELKKCYGIKKIDISEGIDINKTNASKECEVCHYCFFKDIGFNFQEHVCNKCHDLLTIAYSSKNITMLNTKGDTYRYI